MATDKEASRLAVEAQLNAANAQAEPAGTPASDIGDDGSGYEILPAWMRQPPPASGLADSEQIKALVAIADMPVKRLLSRDELLAIRVAAEDLVLGDQEITRLNAALAQAQAERDADREAYRKRGEGWIVLKEQLEAERDEARAEFKRIANYWKKPPLENNRLRANLVKFGEHDPACIQHPRYTANSGPCTCGFTKATEVKA